MNSKYIDEMSEKYYSFFYKMYLMGMTYHKNSPMKTYLSRIF